MFFFSYAMKYKGCLWYFTMLDLLIVKQYFGRIVVVAIEKVDLESLRRNDSSK